MHCLYVNEAAVWQFHVNFSMHHMLCTHSNTLVGMGGHWGILLRGSIALLLPDDPANAITIYSTQLHLKSVVFVGTTLDEAPSLLFTPDHLVVDKVRVWSVLKMSTSAFGVAIEVYTTRGVDGTLGLTRDPSKSTLSAHHSRHTSPWTFCYCRHNIG